MKMLTIFGVFVFVSLWASAASGEVYSWTDEDGVVHFTNFAPPPQAQLIIEDEEGDEAPGAAPQASPREGAIASEGGQRNAEEDRLERTEARVEELEQNLNQAQEKAEALEASLAEANRRAQEAQRIAEEGYGPDGEYVVNDASPACYGGYAYGVVPYSRPFIGEKERRRYYHKGELPEPRYQKHPSSHKPLRGREAGLSRPGINDARTQAERTFYQSRRNPLQSNFISRRQVMGRP